MTDTGPKLVSINERAGLSRTDIPAQLRALADRIEAGQPADAVFVVVMEAPDLVPPVIYGWGNTFNGLYASGALLAAAQFVANGGNRT